MIPWLSWSHHFESFMVDIMTHLPITDYLPNGCVPFVTMHSLSSFMIGFRPRVTRQVPPVKQKLPILPEHTSSPPGFKWGSYCSIFSFLCSVCRLLFCLFSYGHCIVCPSIYSFWLISLWYLQTFLTNIETHVTSGLPTLRHMSHLAYQYGDTCHIWLTNIETHVTSGLPILRHMSHLAYQYWDKCHIWLTNIETHVTSGLPILRHMSHLAYQYWDTCHTWLNS